MLFFRIRAYNAVELLVFILGTYERDNKKRISDFIMEYSTKPLYREVGQKVTKRNNKLPENVVKAEDIKNCGNGIYNVKSKTKKGISYEVDVNVCNCTCPVGISGAKCKHQLGVHLHTQETLINFPELTLNLINLFHKIACGKDPKVGYYASIRNASVSSNNAHRFEGSDPSSPILAVEEMEVEVEHGTVEVETDSADLEFDPAAVENEMTDAQNVSLAEEVEDETDYDTVLEQRAALALAELKKYKHSAAARSSSLIIFDSIVKAARVSENCLVSLAYHYHNGRLSKRRHTTKRINPNPTSIARRKNGTSKGKSRGRCGRPFKNGKNPQQPHSLSHAVKHDRAPTKKH